MQNNQNDVFTLGLVILEMGTLMKVHHCYDFDNQVLNTQNLQSMIQLFE